MPVPAFLVEHPGVGPMLIDTGLHPSVAVDPKQNFGRLLGFDYRGLKMNAEQAVPAQLRARGLDAADIRLVLMTHMHVDHASAISEFPDATFVLSQQEWDVLERREVDRRLRQAPVRLRLRLPHVRLRVARDRVVRDASAARSTCSATAACAPSSRPGHTHGHTSYVLRLRDREVLVAGDAVYTMRTLERERACRTRWPTSTSSGAR